LKTGTLERNGGTDPPVVKYPIKLGLFAESNDPGKDVHIGTGHDG
jgi:hypothetical protein